MNTLFSILFLIVEIAIISFLIYKGIQRKRIFEKNNLFYIIPVFVLVWGMNIFALFYYNNFVQPISCGILDVLALAKDTIESFVFKFNTTLIMPVMKSSVLMLIAYSIMMVLALLTTLLAILILINNVLKNYYKTWKIFKKSGDIILGNGESSRKYNLLNKNSFIWADNIEKSEYDDLIANKHIVYREVLIFLKRKLKKGIFHLILFKDSSYSYSEILELFKDLISHKNNILEKKRVKLIKRFAKKCTDIKKAEELANQKILQIKAKNSVYLHIEASLEEMEAIKEELANLSSTEINSYVLCFNKYQNLAMDFAKNYPISQELPRNFYNENASLKEDKQVNVVFVGFGKVNLELFKNMSINFQFVKENNEKLSKFENKPINYYAYDNCEERLCNDFFTRLDYEFDKDNEKSSLPPMEKICNLTHQKINVYSSELKQNIENVINENSYTYIIVSLKSDLENIAFAQNLQGYLADKKNFKIFARVQESVFYKDNKEITYFGQENKLYSHDIVTNKHLINLARSTKSLHAEKSLDQEIYNWNNLLLMNQYSKVYTSLSVFFKIGMLGYKILPKEGQENDKTISYQEFLANYSYLPEIKERKNYNLYFQNTMDNLMGYIDHSRWCAHYYLWGYKPMNIKDFQPKGENPIGKLKLHGVVKKHSSLTSYDGLDSLHRYIYLMKKYGENYKDYDINTLTEQDIQSKEFMDIEQYYYDYRFLETIQAMLNQGYVIVKK